MMLDHRSIARRTRLRRLSAARADERAYPPSSLEVDELMNGFQHVFRRIQTFGGWTTICPRSSLSGPLGLYSIDSLSSWDENLSTVARDSVQRRAPHDMAIDRPTHRDVQLQHVLS